MLTPTRRLSRRIWVVCLTVALAARVTVVIYAWLHPAPFVYPDSRKYIATARNIAAGRGPMWTNGARCGVDPLFPYLLSVGPSCGAESFEAIMNWGRVVNLVIGLATIPAIMLLGRRAAGDAGAVVAGLFLALDPVQLFFHGLVLTEVTYIFFLLWGIETLLRSIETGRARWSVLAGGLFAAGALARSSGIFLPPVFAAAIPFVRTMAGLTAIRRGAMVVAFVLAYVAVLLPAALRSHRLIGQWLPTRTGGGATLLEGLGPWADGGPAWEKIQWPDYPPGSTELERDHINRDTAIAWARANPGRAFQLAVAKVVRTWSVTFHAPGYQGGAFYWIGWTTVAPTYVLALCGAWLLRRNKPLLFLLLAPVFYYSLLHSIYVGSVRYRVPIMPGLFVLSAASLAFVWQCFRTPRPIANSPE